MKIKKIIKLMVVSVLTLLTPSCSPKEKTYKIEWKLDNTVLKVDNVKEGIVPEYTGETPTKEKTNDKIYIFEGWNPEVVAATQDTVYVAKFKEEIRKYEIKWQNYDGTLLKIEYLEYGDDLLYTGQTPTRENGSHQTYVFDKWDLGTDKIVTKDVTYTAQFREILNTYTVEWKIDDQVVELDENVEYGSIPSYDGDTPKKETTEEKIYYFDGWDKKITAVEGNCVYTAKFKEIDNIWNHYPSTKSGVKTRGNREYWVLDSDETQVVFEKPTICTVVEKEAPTQEIIANWESNDPRIIQPLCDGIYVTLGSYPTDLVKDDALITSLTNELELSSPIIADDNWKAYTHWFAYDSSKSKAVAQTDALYQDIVYDGIKYRAVYFNTELPKNCSQAYSSSNQYQQTNGYNKETLYFFEYQPLKWTIAEETDTYYTLIATKVLDGVCFTHDGAAGYVGNYCDIRLFTENSFYNWAFSESEKELFIDVTFKNDQASGNKVDSVDLTKKISIPSKVELETYFNTTEARKKTTTDYAKLNGVQVNTSGQAYYWTRSRDTNNPHRVGHGGSFDSLATGYFSSAGILPQIYITK